MSLRIPTFVEILNVARSHGTNSEAPKLWNGLVGCWPFQEGGGKKTYDVSGYGNDGTLTNMDPATDWVVGENGWGLDFDGSDDCNALPDMSSRFTTEASFSAWLKLAADPPSGATTSGLAMENNASSGVRSHYPYTNGLLYSSVFATSRVINAFDNSGFNKAAWHLLTITSSPGAGNYKLYQNGVLVTTGTGDASVSVPASPFLGLSGAIIYFKGRMGNVLLHNRALVPDESQRLYTDPWAMFRSPTEWFPAAVAGVTAPTAVLDGPLVGPLGGPV